MARYQVILAYDGTDFAGSQRQARARTVQGELERALRHLGWAGRAVMMAGRTDSGVHATGQVAAFDLEWRHSPEDLLRALNANLPPDLAVWQVKMTSSEFHPRFDAIARRYRYRLFCREVRDPLRERFAWRVWPPVDGERLRALAPLWEGQHDFAAFGSPTRPQGSTVRTVHHASWECHEDEWWFEIQADAFLYHMVRRMVAAQVAVAQGRLPAESIARALADPARVRERSEKGLGGGLAPACGLTLVEVVYPPSVGQASDR
ncbi:MAG: tRNA pseudouridine(38-40) synthase TruA [Anaerolineae bacterium]|nr:MAG: tRNA pseudouridine(38-40) synthase TruA [Anaerolineae bacterium]